MYKLIFLFIPISLLIFQIILSLPSVSDFLKISNVITQIIIGSIIVFIFILNQIFGIYKPVLKFKRFERTKLELLDRESIIITDLYKQSDIELRINVMIPRRVFVTCTEPKRKNNKKRKLTFFTKIFQSIWVNENMLYDQDKNLNLTINQGVCGEAYRSCGKKVGDFTIQNPSDFNLNYEQLQKTKDLKFVFSCPIFEMSHTDFRLSNDIIGVVNFDSKTKGSEKLIDEDGNDIIEITKKIHAFSQLCSQIF